MDANFSTMTMPKTMPAQNLLRYISFKKTVARILILSKLWYFLFWFVLKVFLFWFVLKVPQFWKKQDLRNWLLKMNGLYTWDILYLLLEQIKALKSISVCTLVFIILYHSYCAKRQKSSFYVINKAVKFWRKKRLIQKTWTIIIV